jgi:hypothetical protein
MGNSRIPPRAPSRPFYRTARHPQIYIEVSSYWFDAVGVAFDPLLSDEGLNWFASRAQSSAVVVRPNRHHLRHAQLFAERVACRRLLDDLYSNTCSSPWQACPGEWAIGGMGDSARSRPVCRPKS